MVSSFYCRKFVVFQLLRAVRLGNSGLKVSRIILGCMSYGSPEWQSWVLPEEEAIKHIKFAYVNCIDLECPMVADEPYQIRPWHSNLRHGECKLICMPPFLTS